MYAEEKKENNTTIEIRSKENLKHFLDYIILAKEIPNEIATMTLEYVFEKIDFNKYDTNKFGEINFYIEVDQEQVDDVKKIIEHYTYDDKLKSVKFISSKQEGVGINLEKSCINKIKNLIEKSKSLESLSMEGFSCDDFSPIFKALEFNSSLKIISLKGFFKHTEDITDSYGGCWINMPIDSKSINQIVESLPRNNTLEMVDLSKWSIDSYEFVQLAKMLVNMEENNRKLTFIVSEQSKLDNAKNEELNRIKQEKSGEKKLSPLPNSAGNLIGNREA